MPAKLASTPGLFVTCLCLLQQARSLPSDALFRTPITLPAPACQGASFLGPDRSRRLPEVYRYFTPPNPEPAQTVWSIGMLRTLSIQERSPGSGRLGATGMRRMS
jgi:hypothetical protein